MVYRISHDEVQKAQDEYKKNYAPFKPFVVAEWEKGYIAESFTNVISTQNGMDTDDYCIDEDNKLERYLKLANINPPGNALLLGTGTGREVVLAKSLGFQAAGTTLGSRNVDYGILHLGLGEEELIECLNESLPWKSNTFDVIAGFQVFEHTMMPLIFLLEQGRVLKKGGKLILEWPPASTHSGGDNPHHQVCFTPGQARDLMLKAGFTNIQLVYGNGDSVKEEDLWKSENIGGMLVAIGTKSDPKQSYIANHWSK